MGDGTEEVEYENDSQKREFQSSFICQNLNRAILVKH